MEPGMKIKEVNWYGFDHNKIAQRFVGNLKYLNTFCVNGEYSPVAVYLNQDFLVPAKRKKMRKDFKKYVLIQMESTGRDGGRGGIIRGMDQRKMNKNRYQEAIHCLQCGDVVYSVMRHDMRPCQCGSVSVDGGKDYTKVSFKKRDSYKLVLIDLLTNEIFVEGVVPTKTKKRKSKK